MPVNSHIGVQPLTKLLKCCPVSHLLVNNLDQVVQLSAPKNIKIIILICSFQPVKQIDVITLWLYMERFLISSVREGI